MKTKKLIPLAVMAAFFINFSSCDSEDIHLTGINGLPGNMFSAKNGDDYDEDITFYYQGDRLTKLIAKGGPGSIYDFEYEGNEPIRISVRPEDPRVADGNASTTFKKEGNRILIESTGDPFSLLATREMEQNDGGRPVRLTETGKYALTEAGRELINEGGYYTDFTFDDAGNLIRIEKYSLQDSEQVSVHTFTYDNSPGVVNKINLPLWFRTYWNLNHNYSTGGYNKMFLNYVNNLVSMTIVDNENGFNWTEDYTYTYDKTGFPISANYSKSGETVQINY